ncbi:MAG: alanine--tRNA ligase [Synergistaceae bacterium]|nr:alanine--tRNA ligase [Synergistaceae bacterium]
MKYRSGKEIRKMFMEFWAQKGSCPTPSFSLIPDDPSLLFTIAGMVPLKEYYLGLRVPEHPSVHTSQKCVRTNDIENVGRTARHHTFFEMLGNFAWGNYFKKESITWGMEFLTSDDWMGLDGSRMSASIYKDDEEAYDVWHNIVGLPDDRIFRFGEDGNFWFMAETGPCGPCSEIYYDRGPTYECDNPNCNVGCDCDRYLEIWNHVFTQFDRQKDGSLKPLPEKNIDTGMGLERLAALIQEVRTDYETDLFMPLVEETCRRAGIIYGANSKSDMAARVIADHSRSVAFMLADGVLPTNDGPGYVLRRLLRRAARFGKLLGFEEPFLCDTIPIIIEIMGDPYQELIVNRKMIEQVISVEEERFDRTLIQGTNLLDEEIRSLKSRNESELPGGLAFKLYDTYGFPVELTAEMSEEQGISVNMSDFSKEMDAARELARSSSKQKKSALTGNVYNEIERNVKSASFTGYTDDSGSAVVKAIVKDDELVDSLKVGEEGEIIFDTTPFYAERGGEVGDTGVGSNTESEIKVDDVVIRGKSLFSHRVKVMSGTVVTGMNLDLKVDTERRNAIRRNHTATHLLHEALGRVLGGHVRQAGSYVTESSLRFDFTHFEALTDEQKLTVENIVNYEILENKELLVTECSIEKAREVGAKALFDEKYGAVVRVVNVPDFSIELCGGLHVEATGNIGLFKIISDESIGSGTRRIFAITGATALRGYQAATDLLRKLFGIIGSDEKSALAKIEGMMNEVKTLQKKIEAITRQDLLNNAEIVLNKKEIGELTFQYGKFVNQPDELLRDIGDKAKDEYSKTVIVMASISGDKCKLTVMADDKAVSLGANAGALVQAACALLGGKGGGRGAMASGGGNSKNIDAAFVEVEKLLNSQLSK